MEADNNGVSGFKTVVVTGGGGLLCGGLGGGVIRDGGDVVSRGG